VPEAVNAEAVKVVFGKIQLESASEISDSSLELVSAQRGD
jgi:hypothetical protein